LNKKIYDDWSIRENHILYWHENQDGVEGYFHWSSDGKEQAIWRPTSLRLPSPVLSEGVCISIPRPKFVLVICSPDPIHSTLVKRGNKKRSLCIPVANDYQLPFLQAASWPIGSQLPVENESVPLVPTQCEPSQVDLPIL